MSNSSISCEQKKKIKDKNKTPAKFIKEKNGSLFPNSRQKETLKD